MRISKKTEYGLTAMVHLAKNENGKVSSIREISNIEGVPFEFLSKIFVCLEKAKIVEAKHGANGGYALAKSPKNITVSDIVSLLEKMKVVECGPCVKSKKCLTKNVWSRVDGAISKTLKSITLADLIK